MSKFKIIQKRVGYSNSTLIVNSVNSVLVDTGVKGHIKLFRKLFEQESLQPNDIKLIVLTHTHYDHTGNLHELVQLTGADVLVHKNEFENLKQGFTPIPTGQGFYTRFVTRLGKLVFPRFASPKAFTANIVNEDEFDLQGFGLNGRVISTPGHSAGSQSVLLNDMLISGDAFINLRNGIIFPHFADDPEMLLRTWKHLYDRGVKIIYPGHGPRMKVEKTFPAFEHWKKKLNITD